MTMETQGRLRCLGTPAHIKNRHGAGYQLEIFTECDPGSTNRSNLSSEPSQDVRGFVEGLCKNSSLMEFHEGRYLFQIPVLKAVGAGAGELSLATLFMRMQEAKHRIGLRDYSISRPSLEQVFLRFSKEQEELSAQMS